MSELRRIRGVKREEKGGFGQKERGTNEEIKTPKQTDWWLNVRAAGFNKLCTAILFFFLIQ